MRGWTAIAALLVCLCGCGAPTPAAAPRGAVVPVVNRDYFPTLMQMIEGAQKTVEFIQLEWHYTPETVGKIQEALRDAGRRGVRVRGLIEDHISFNPRSVEFLVEKFGVDAKLDTPEKISPSAARRGRS